MEPLYSAGCRAHFHPGSDYTTNPFYSDCISLTRTSSHSGLLLCIHVIACVLLHRFILTPAALAYLYGTKYSLSSREKQQKFRLHQVGVVVKLFSLFSILFPTIVVVLNDGLWTEPLCSTGGLGCSVTQGDAAFFAASLVAALNIFDLIYDESLRVLSIAHHIGSLLTIQGTLQRYLGLPVNDLDQISEVSAVARVCLLWVLFSGFLSIASRVIFIFRRFYPDGGIRLRRLYFLGFVGYEATTAVEVVMVVCLLFSKEDVISLRPTVTLCLLQVLFTCTKANTGRRILAIYRVQVRTNTASTESPERGNQLGEKQTGQ